MPILHDFQPSGNGYKARLLMTFLGIPFRYREHDILKGETRTPAFLERINANGRIPVLELDDGRTLPESNAILCYLGEGTAWVPEDRFERAEMMSWLFFEQYSHEPYIATLRFWLHVGNLTPEREAQLPAKRAGGEAALSVMERRLEDRDWFAGSRPSLADIALYAYTHAADEAEFDLARWPAVESWLARFAALPGYIPITRTDFD